MNLFENPIKTTKVKAGVYAYKYPNGCIKIDGQKYIGYSITEAIKLFRKKNKTIT